MGNDFIEWAIGLGIAAVVLSLFLGIAWSILKSFL